MTASHQNVNAPTQLSPAHFLWIRAFSHASVNGDGVTALNWVPVFALQPKVICLPRVCPLFNFLPNKIDPGAFRKREMKVRSYFRKTLMHGDFPAQRKVKNVFQWNKTFYFKINVKNFLLGFFLLRQSVTLTMIFDDEWYVDIWFWCVLCIQFLYADLTDIGQNCFNVGHSSYCPSLLIRHVEEELLKLKVRSNSTWVDLKAFQWVILTFYQSPNRDLRPQQNYWTRFQQGKECTCSELYCYRTVRRHNKAALNLYFCINPYSLLIFHTLAEESIPKFKPRSI